MGDQAVRLRAILWPALLVTAAGASFAVGLSRGLAETFYLTLGWLAAWQGTALLALLILPIVLAAWRWQCRRNGKAPMVAAAAFLPLFLPVAYVFHDQVNLIHAYTWLAGSVLLTGLVAADSRVRVGSTLRLSLLVAVTLGVYLGTLGRTVGRADTFEFQVVASKLGIAHPTGYPLYLLLGKLFTLLPVGSIAFRVNLLSAVCALTATVLVYAILQKLCEGSSTALRLAGLSEELPVLGALAFAFSPALWSQAVEAEVYALNSLFVASVLWALVRMALAPSREEGSSILVLALALILGLSLTNHVTAVILLPVTVLALFLARRNFWRRSLHRIGVRGSSFCSRSRLWLLGRAALLFVAGLSLYLYLPLRWPAFHDGRLMKLGEFLDWVGGGRFRGALNLSAWRADPTRYGIVGRLVLDQWGWIGVALAGAGLFWLLLRLRRVAFITVPLWLGYAFYALSYYVPDVSVFLIPAHLVMAVWMGCGVVGAVEVGSSLMSSRPVGLRVMGSVAVTLLAVLPLTLVIQNYSSVDRSAPNPLEAWGRYVLGLDLDPGAAILADSERIAPLYYLQQTEGLRADLDIMVLPDEAAYRAELGARVAAGQTVYLARFLPGLEGEYHLRSLPGAPESLVEVANRPLAEPPALDGRLNARFGGHVALLGYTTLDTGAMGAPDSWQVAYPDPFHITLYWTTDARVGAVYQVWMRLVDGEGSERWRSDGIHPAGNYYPTSAWRPEEIVPDGHQIALSPGLSPGEYELQVALLVPFGGTGLTPDAQSSPWLSVGKLNVQSPRQQPIPRHVTRIWADGVVILGMEAPTYARPEAQLPLHLYLAGEASEPLRVGWSGEPEREARIVSSVASFNLSTPARTGDHAIDVWAGQSMRCGWLHRLTERCSMAHVAVGGAPLPAGATNYGDLIALLAADIADLRVRPGGTLDVTLTWQGLAPIGEDYTLFLHVLDPVDQIVGQVDSWPVQGTYPTSQWSSGTPIVDRYSIRIADTAAPGAHRLEIGWYLLRTMKRLSVIGLGGQALDDRLLIEGVVVQD